MTESYDDQQTRFYLENAWETARKFSSSPVSFYKYQTKGAKLPMDAYMDGYTDDVMDNVSSYGSFESEYIDSNDYDRSQRLRAEGKSLVFNNMYVDMSLNGRETAIDRIEINKNDGYVSHSVLEGSRVKNNEVSIESWENTPGRTTPETKSEELGATPLYISPKVFAWQTQSLGFGRDKIGNPDGFFLSRGDFIDEFNDADEFTAKDAMEFDTRVNPNIIGFKPKLNSIHAFSDIIGYSRFTGIHFPVITSMVLPTIYFAHEVLNTLYPKQIVLVMYSYTNQIDIPKKDYIPNVNDPVLNFPDYENRLRHIIEMMKKINQKMVFDPMLGDFYLKMSITPAMLVINFISSLASNARLILEFPMIDNQILYDGEIMHNVSPTYFLSNSSKYWHHRGDCGSDHELLNEIRTSYECKLNGIQASEMDQYMMQYTAPDQGFGNPNMFITPGNPNGLIF